MARESYDATISSSDAEDAADVHEDAACENALVYDGVPSVDDAPINSLNVVVSSRYQSDETNVQDPLESPYGAANIAVFAELLFIRTYRSLERLKTCAISATCLKSYGQTTHEGDTNLHERCAHLVRMRRLKQ